MTRNKFEGFGFLAVCSVCFVVFVIFNGVSKFLDIMFLMYTILLAWFSGASFYRR